MNLMAILLIVFVHPIITRIGFTISCKHLAPTQNIPKKINFIIVITHVDKTMHHKKPLINCMKKLHNCVKNATLHRQLTILCSLEFFFLVLELFSQKLLIHNVDPTIHYKNTKNLPQFSTSLKEGKKN
jgi:hypothetical protein